MQISNSTRHVRTYRRRSNGSREPLDAHAREFSRGPHRPIPSTVKKRNKSVSFASIETIGTERSYLVAEARARDEIGLRRVSQPASGRMWMRLKHLQLLERRGETVNYRARPALPPRISSSVRCSRQKFYTVWEYWLNAGQLSAKIARKEESRGCDSLLGGFSNFVSTANESWHRILVINFRCSVMWPTS